MANYKFKEDVILSIIRTYIDDTYSKHYANGKYQATDMILDAGHGEGFAMGNIMKYAMRYGKKEGKNSKDLLKCMHYIVLMFHYCNFDEPLLEDNNVVSD